MKITRQQLKKIIMEELSEAYGDLGPDAPTEKAPKLRTMGKQTFLDKQFDFWIDEFNAESDQEWKLVNSVLEDAYDSIGKALELDGTGLYENKNK